MNARLTRIAAGSLSLIALIIGVVQAGCEDRPTAPPAPGGEKALQLEIGHITTELQAVDSDAIPLKLKISLEGLIKERISESEALAFKTSDPGQARRKTARLRVTARVLPDGFSGKLHALVSLRVTRTGSIPLSADIDAVRAGPPDGGVLDESDYVEHLTKAVADAVTALDEQAKLLGSGNKALIKALDHEEADVRIAAVRTLGERRARDAIEPICGVLRREKTQVAKASIGALVIIGDEAATPCLIQWAGSDDRRLLLIIDPLSTIGGHEAQAFLEMITSGHEDHRIRNVAEDALKRVRAPSKQGKSPGSTGGH